MTTARSRTQPLPIGVVGLNFGRHVIEHLALPANRRYFRVAAVCDLDRDKARRMAAKLGVKAYFTLEELLADEAIPVIGLFTGPDGRAKLLRHIITAGKDVMSTKPFENDSRAAEAVLRQAIRLKRVVHLNSPAPRPSPDLELIERWRRAHRLGRPIAARCDTWVSYREKTDGSWYDDSRRCPVAPIFRLGIYMINDLVALLGTPEEVQVLQSRVFTGRPTPDNAQLSIRFESGALANIFASFCVKDSQEYRSSLTLNFERGTIYRNVGPRSGAKGVEMMLVREGKTGRQKVEHKQVAFGSGDYQWAEFHRAVRQRALPTLKYAQQVVAGLEIIAAMRRAEIAAPVPPAA